MSENMGIKDMFTQMNQPVSHGIQGYHVYNKYVDPLEQIKQR